MLVALDGPAGAGKSTVARAVADALGFTYLDTGAMYRCVGLRADAGPDPARPAVDVAALDIRFDGDRVLLDGEDVSAAIRTPRAAQAASRVATDPAVRTALVERQRLLIADGDWVAEGRDIGTVVAPDAELKIWLTADPAERARRRELPVAELLERDERDASRDVAPMKPADDAVQVDTTGLSIDEVVARITGLVGAVR
jgi:cytidylate kinase